MSTSGETADLVVKESIQITESAVKLAGLGAKNLAALLVALAKDNPKLAGKTGLKRLIQDGEELTIFSVKQEDLKGFQMESKRYGVLFYPIINRVEKTGTVEIMAKAKDAQQINRIFERMGYPAPVHEDAPAKKANPRARSESSFRERGNGAKTSTEMDKPSVRAKMLELKKVSEQMARQANGLPAGWPRLYAPRVQRHSVGQGHRQQQFGAGEVHHRVRGQAQH